MRLLIYSLTILVLGVWLAQVLREDTGYVLIGIGGWTIEMSFVMFTILSVILILASHYVLRTLGGVGKTPKVYKKWRIKKRAEKATLDLSNGLLAQTEGQWQKAERSLISKVEDSKQPVVNYLEAAKAASAQGASERADRYLRMAHEVAPKKDLSVETTRIELMLSNNKIADAIDALKKLHHQHPKHPRLLELLARAYRAKEDWQGLIDLLPKLHKHHALNLDTHIEFENDAYNGLIRDALASKDANRIRQSWAALPKKIQETPDMIATYVKGMLALGESSSTENILRKAIDHQWSEELVHLYGLLTEVNVAKQIEQAEKWLVKHQDSGALLLTLGRLNIHKKFWGKARSYLESSIAANPNPETYYELAQLLEQIDEKEQANDYYRQGLTLAANSTQFVAA